MDAVKAKPTTFKMGGTGSAQEDQILTIQQEQALWRQGSSTCRSRAAARCA